MKLSKANFLENDIYARALQMFTFGNSPIWRRLVLDCYIQDRDIWTQDTVTVMLKNIDSIR